MIDRAFDQAAARIPRPLPHHPEHAPAISRALELWAELTQQQFFGWVLYLCGQSQRNTSLIAREQAREHGEVLARLDALTDAVNRLADQLQQAREVQ